MATINDFMELDIRVREIIQVKTFIKRQGSCFPFRYENLLYHK